MSRNVIKEYVDFTGKILKNYTKKIMGKYYDNGTFEKYLTKYLNIRYYNEEQWVRKDMSDHLTYYLTQIYEKEPAKTSKFMLELFKKYYYIDDVLEFDFEKDLDNYVRIMSRIRREKVGEIDDNFENDFKNLLNENEAKRLEFLSLFDSSDFYLEMKNVDENVYDVDLKEKVRIPKIFSEYAVKKVWNDTLVAENKLQVEYSLLNQHILKSIIGCDFSAKYIVPITESIFKKEDKLKRTIKIFDNDIAKDLITLKISYDGFKENKDLILSYIREGYQFALILNDKYFEDNSSNAVLDMFEYVIVVDEKHLKGQIKDLKNVIMIN